MSDAIPLLLLLLCMSSKRSPNGSSSPLWPSAASPPPLPPMPGVVPAMPSADTGTPLPDVPEAAAPPPPGGAQPADTVTTPTQALHKMIDARNDLYTAVSRKVRKKKPLPPVLSPKTKVSKYLGLPVMPGAKFATPPAGPPPPPQMNVSVADVQSALLKRGVTIRKDGIYGPRTETAWYELAQRRKLSPMINRVTSKIARVARDTYLTLSGPDVP